MVRRWRWDARDPSKRCKALAWAGIREWSETVIGQIRLISSHYRILARAEHDSTNVEGDFRPDGLASSFTTSSFASANGLKSYFKAFFDLKNVVIRNSFCRKEMTTMTTFWGVCGSCSHDWDTKVSASGQGAGRSRRRGVDGARERRIPHRQSGVALRGARQGLIFAGRITSPFTPGRSSRKRAPGVPPVV
jgi:hypothetical protein